AGTTPNRENSGVCTLIANKGEKQTEKKVSKAFVRLGLQLRSVSKTIGPGHRGEKEKERKRHNHTPSRVE
ncbi:hypothetical protein PoMZ_09673, partial [Pyricularia oryzae]